ncbi:MoaD/ThiS family protein [Cellulomonas triticagri]|uniref:MoaD/ThiS family protein n=1 Tax=Cellulomonas triticagri TaxID=2483352 RepID=A0A3M2JBF3_9CELL|nr:MoaD/ThiS family protein [Cellulomonas triticagri]RMI09140.1 MoaD/ThiS family protein [Cellulomonas triticagri]
MPHVLVRYFAGAGAAAGVPEERVTLPVGSTTADLVADACRRHGPDLDRVAAACSVLVDGVLDADRTATLADGTGVDLLPPFAGG